MILAELQGFHVEPVPRALGKAADNIRIRKAFGFRIQGIRPFLACSSLIKGLLQVMIHDPGIQPEQVIEGH
ncbi:hypothetical protein D3C81_2156850 [compost metagenome]